MNARLFWALAGCVALLLWALVPAGAPAQARGYALLNLTETAFPPTATNTQPPAPSDTPTTGPGPSVTPTGGPARPTLTPSPGPRPTDDSPDDDEQERPDLQIVKRANPAAGRPGDFITFVIEVTNRGNGTARDVEISDTLPSFLEVYFVETTKGIVSNQGQSVSVRLDELAPGEVVTVTIRARIRDDATPQRGENGATVNPGGARASVVIEVLPPLATATPAPGIPPVPVALPPTGTAANGRLWLALLALMVVGTGLLLRKGR
jgi:uncharacterized repeat protein (TIGR01451 family)